MKPRELLQLLMDKHGDNPNSLSQKTKVPQPTIFRFITGTAKEPRRRTLEPIAKHYGIGVEAFFNDKAAAETAAKLLGHVEETTTNVAPGPDIRGRVPLISWVRAGELCESPDIFQPGDAEEWLYCPVPHGPSTYCLQVVGDSQDDGTPEGYRDGEIIFVDPDVEAVPGDDVVVRTLDNKMTFKRLKQDTEGLYLLGLNGKRIIRVPEGTVFCGVVIFSGVKRR